MEASAISLLKDRDSSYDPSVWGQLSDGEDGPRPRPVNPRKAPLPLNTFSGRRAERLKKQADLHGHANGERAMFDIPLANRRTRVWSDEKLKDLLCWTSLPEDDAFTAAARSIGNWKLTPDRAIELLHLNPLSAEAVKRIKRLQPGDPLRSLKRHLMECPNDVYRKRLRRRILGASRTVFVELKEHELCIDIDADTDGPQATASAYLIAHAIVDDVFIPAGVRCFIEPSRSRSGVYVRVIVSRESDVRAFNKLIERLTHFLQNTFTDPAGLAHVCKISKVAWWEDNTAFDAELYAEVPQYRFDDGEDCSDDIRSTFGESYEFKKAKHGQDSRFGRVEWKYNPVLEPHLLHGTDLLTAPLHALVKDADGGADRLDRFRSFRADPSSIVSESLLRSIVPAEYLDDDVATTPTVTVVGLDATADDAVCAGRDAAIFEDQSADVHLRYMAASRPCLREAKGDLAKAIDLTLSKVESSNGPATGPRHHERIDHATRAVEFSAQTYDASKHGFGRMEPEFTQRWTDNDVAWAVKRCRKAGCRFLSEHDIDPETAGKVLLTYMDALDQHPDGCVSVDTLVKYSGAARGECALLYQLFTQESSKLLVLKRNHWAGHYARSFELHHKCRLPGFLDAATVKRASPPPTITPRNDAIEAEQDEAELQWMIAEYGVTTLPDGRSMCGTEECFWIVDPARLGGSVNGAVENSTVIEMKVDGAGRSEVEFGAGEVSQDNISSNGGVQATALPASTALRYEAFAFFQLEIGLS